MVTVGVRKTSGSGITATEACRPVAQEVRKADAL